MFFFFNDTATTEIYTLSLHDALPIWPKPIADWSTLAARPRDLAGHDSPRIAVPGPHSAPSPSPVRDRKSTRLNSSHLVISYAVFCLKKKKTQKILLTLQQARGQNYAP